MVEHGWIYASDLMASYAVVTQHDVSVDGVTAVKPCADGVIVTVMITGTDAEGRKTKVAAGDDILEAEVYIPGGRLVKMATGGSVNLCEEAGQ